MRHFEVNGAQKKSDFRLRFDPGIDVAVERIAFYKYVRDGLFLNSACFLPAEIRPSAKLLSIWRTEEGLRRPGNKHPSLDSSVALESIPSFEHTASDPNL